MQEKVRKLLTSSYKIYTTRNRELTDVSTKA